MEFDGSSFTDDIQTKRCNKCGEMKALSEFATNKSRSDGKTSYCKVCIRAQVKEAYHRDEEVRKRKKRWWASNPDSSKIHNRKQRLRKYGLTPEDYRSLLEKQNGVCAICGNPETLMCGGCVIQLAVDHDHQTGKVRGLLCRNCNVGLGFLETNFDFVERALNYKRNANQGS